MNPIQIRMLCGAASGRVRVFEEPELSFGRTPDNTIVIESAHASRQHGALVFDEDGWHVLNASANGTTVNGKAVGKKKLVLKNGDVIGVAGRPLFAVEILPVPEVEEATAAPFAQSAFTSGPQMSGVSPAGPKQSKLWMGLGGYFAAIVVVFLILSLVTGGDKDGGASMVPPLSRDQIAASITKPISLGKDERLVRQSLQTARERYQRAETETSALYDAYIHFKRAGAYSGGAVFDDGLVYREYKKCEEELIERVSRTYAEGYKQLRAGQWQQAVVTFRQLQQMYQDQQSEVYRNTQQQLAAARSHRRR
ncbi:MAG: FHA domain-containing protein [Phycisphaerales bacterium]